MPPLNLSQHIKLTRTKEFELKIRRSIAREFNELHGTIHHCLRRFAKAVVKRRMKSRIYIQVRRSSRSRTIKGYFERTR